MPWSYFFTTEDSNYFPSKEQINSKLLPHRLLAKHARIIDHLVRLIDSIKQFEAEVMLTPQAAFHSLCSRYLYNPSSDKNKSDPLSSGYAKLLDDLEDLQSLVELDESWKALAEKIKQIIQEQIAWLHLLSEAKKLSEKQSLRAQSTTIRVALKASLTMLREQNAYIQKLLNQCCELTPQASGELRFLEEFNGIPPVSASEDTAWYIVFFDHPNLNEERFDYEFCNGIYRWQNGEWRYAYEVYFVISQQAFDALRSYNPTPTIADLQQWLANNKSLLDNEDDNGYAFYRVKDAIAFARNNRHKDYRILQAKTFIDDDGFIPVRLMSLSGMAKHDFLPCFPLSLDRDEDVTEMLNATVTGTETKATEKNTPSNGTTSGTKRKRTTSEAHGRNPALLMPDPSNSCSNPQMKKVKFSLPTSSKGFQPRS